MLSLVVTLALAPLAQTNPWLEGARSQLGVPYGFGGRRRDASDGIDCLGLVLAGAERATGCGWKSFSWNPTDLVRRKSFGAPVKDLSPVSSALLDVSKLQPGDVLMLVGPDENPREPPIGTLDGLSVWVWHVGLYAGGGKWLVGDHFAGKAVETDLMTYLSEHADVYSGVFVTRPPGVKPSRCRKDAFLSR